MACFTKIINFIPVLLVISGLIYSPARANESMTLVYSGNLDGELEPCGCSAEGDLGGMLRRATMLSTLREKSPDMITLSSGGLLASMVAQDKLTGEYILKAFPAFSYDAIGLQWSDLAYGQDFILNNNLPWVSSNWLDGAFLKEKKIERNNRQVSFFSWLDSSQSPQSSMKGDHQLVTDHTEDLHAQLKARHGQGITTILSTSLPYDQVKAKLPLSYIDVLLIESAYEEFGEPQLIDGTLVLQPGSRGMRLGMAGLVLNKQGRVTEFTHKVITMPSTVEDSQALLPWYQEYNDKVKAVYLARVAQRKAEATGDSPYAGEQKCELCHQSEYEIWKQSLHSNAFGKLEDVNKAFDPACIGCHTVGFEKQGGFIDIDASDHLMGVQCESCHGAGQAHAKSAGQQPLENQAWQPEQMCAQCHIQKHSPGFEFDTYWPRVRHGTGK